MDRNKKIAGLLGWLLLCFGAGAFAAYFDPGPWYQALAKPAWTPPDWVFPIVWPLLYLCMAVAAWMIWKNAGFSRGRSALQWFLIQLVLNAAWSWLFFGEQMIATALGEIFLLLVAIIFTTMLFWKIVPAAGWLMVPYLLWVGYASALNMAIWQMN